MHLRIRKQKEELKKAAAIKEAGGGGTPLFKVDSAMSSAGTSQAPPPPPPPAAEDYHETMPMDIVLAQAPAEPERVPSPQRSAKEMRKAYHGREVPEDDFTPSEPEDSATFLSYLCS